MALRFVDGNWRIPTDIIAEKSAAYVAAAIRYQAAMSDSNKARKLAAWNEMDKVTEPVGQLLAACLVLTGARRGVVWFGAEKTADEIAAMLPDQLVVCGSADGNAVVVSRDAAELIAAIPTSEGLGLYRAIGHIATDDARTHQLSWYVRMRVPSRLDEATMPEMCNADSPRVNTGAMGWSNVTIPIYREFAPAVWDIAALRAAAHNLGTALQKMHPEINGVALSVLTPDMTEVEQALVVLPVVSEDL